jgi:uncharacterized membrane protein YphA (DoxX/SURF4 family)
MALRKEGLKDAALFVLRAAGFMLFYLHGLGKLKDAYGHFAHGSEWQFAGLVSQTGLPVTTLLALFATFAEGVASLGLAAGLWTRYSALVVTASMSGAIYLHLKTGTKPELALMYWAISFLFIFMEPGRFAIDSWRRGGRR